MRRQAILALPLAVVLSLIGTLAFGQGKGPVADDATLEQKVDWLIREMGSSEDGLTIRRSIAFTDDNLNELSDSIEG